MACITKIFLDLHLAKFLNSAKLFSVWRYWKQLLQMWFVQLFRLEILQRIKCRK